jgi:hypothetical protein
MTDYDFIKLECSNTHCFYSSYAPDGVYLLIKLTRYKDTLHRCPICRHPMLSEVDVSVYLMLSEMGLEPNE